MKVYAEEAQPTAFVVMCPYQGITENYGVDNFEKKKRGAKKNEA